MPLLTKHCLEDVSQGFLMRDLGVVNQITAKYTIVCINVISRFRLKSTLDKFSVPYGFILIPCYPHIA